MTAKRQPDGSTVYRHQIIQQCPNTRPGTRGHYTWNGQTFAQLGHAKAAIDDKFRRTPQ